MELDIHKAFDSVNLGFIKELLSYLKFPTQFVKWVMACLSSVSFKLHINGHIRIKFKGGRGFKQWDPLSPLLFILTMEYFTRLMKQ